MSSAECGRPDVSVVKFLRGRLSPVPLGGIAVPPFGAFDLDVAGERLRAFAAEYGQGGPPRRYVLAENALLEESAALANAPLVMNLIRRYRRLITVELPFTATKVIARSNIRILGLGPRGDRTARIQMRRGVGSLRREIRARRVIATIRRRMQRNSEPEAQIPAMLEMGANWLVEEQVEGQHAGEMQMRRFAATLLPAFYRSTLRQRPYRGPMQLAALETEAARLLPGFSLGDQRGLWPVALCKGDLNSSNILWAPGDKFWMIDWELSRVMAIALDLATACFETPALIDVSLNILRAFSTADCVPPEIQLTLGFARMSFRFARERRIGNSVDATEREFDAQRMAKVRNLMQTAFGR
jgi:hypothetical protein